MEVISKTRQLHWQRSTIWLTDRVVPNNSNTSWTSAELLLQYVQDLWLAHKLLFARSVISIDDWQQSTHPALCIGDLSPIPELCGRVGMNQSPVSSLLSTSQLRKIVSERNKCHSWCCWYWSRYPIWLTYAISQPAGLVHFLQVGQISIGISAHKTPRDDVLCLTDWTDRTAFGVNVFLFQSIEIQMLCLSFRWCRTTTKELSLQLQPLPLVKWTLPSFARILEDSELMVDDIKLYTELQLSNHADERKTRSYQDTPTTRDLTIIIPRREEIS